MKKLYESPEINILLLSAQDIMSQSDNDDSEFNDDNEAPILPPR